MEGGKIKGVGDKDLEAGAANIPLGGGQGEDERFKHWPSASKLKGQPGLLTVMVKMEHLLLHNMVEGDGFRGMMSLGGDERVAELRLLIAERSECWRVRQRRYLILAFLAVCLDS